MKDHSLTFQEVPSMAGKTGLGCLLGRSEKAGSLRTLSRGQEGERHSGACVECDRHGRLPWSSPQRERTVAGRACSAPTKQLWSERELNAHCWLTHMKRIKPKRVVVLEAAVRKGSGL